MTRATNARIAGAALLIYIAVGISVLVLDSATAGADAAARIARYGEYAGRVRLGVVLSFLTSAMAVTLAVTLEALTRDQDADLAAMGKGFRLGEGILGAGGQISALALLWIAAHPTSAALSSAPLLLQIGGWNALICSMLFAMGSVLFSWLLLRGRVIPVPLAWLGVFASVLLVVALPLQIMGVLRGALVQLVWLPMAAYEIPLGLWLIFRGAALPGAAAGAAPGVHSGGTSIAMSPSARGPDRRVQMFSPGL